MRGFRGKILCMLILLVAISSLLPACTSNKHNKGVQIITTAFPAYDIVRTLTKDCEDVNVRLLLSPGTESHSYDPSAADMMSVHDADLFVYIGQAADVWAERMIRAADESLQTFVLTDKMELLKDADHNEVDPHVWTSPANVITIVNRLTPVLCALPDLSSEDSAKIETAATTYVQDLQNLDQAFRDFFQGIPEDERLLVFGDRFPFRYFAEKDKADA